MKIFFTLMLNFCLVACIAVPALAQSESDIEDAVEAIETIVEELGINADDVGDSIEAALDEYSDEIEDWAEEYSAEWEAWAEKFEKRFDRWAQDQEAVWEDWADSYGQKWERWAEQMEAGDWDPDELNGLIQKNLEMLGEMPLGELVEGMLKEGTEGFESAPWESLQGLQGMLQKSIERSLVETERRLADAESRVRDSEDELEFILPVIKEQQKSLKAKQKRLSKEAAATLDTLRDKLLSGKTTESDLKELRRLVLQQEAAMAAQKKEVAKQQRLAKESHRQAERAKRAALAQREQAEEAKLAAEKRLARSLDSVKDRGIVEEKTNSSNRKKMQALFQALEAEEQKIQDKNDELEQLRREVQKLRKEVQKLADDRNDK